jgi:hypothetical protein
MLPALAQAARAAHAIGWVPALSLIAACAADPNAKHHDDADAADTDFTHLDGAVATQDASREAGVPPAADASADSSTNAAGKGDAGIESTIVAPGSGPASCGCAAGHLCVRWAPLHSKLPGGLECWPVPTCTWPGQLLVTGSECSCFNPCNVRHPGGGTFCFDRNDGAQITGAEDIHCVQGQP